MQYPECAGKRLSDVKHGLLSMLAKGNIVRDKNEVARKTKSVAAKMLLDIGGKSRQHYSNWYNQLIRIPKHLTPEATPVQRNFLLADFTAYISSLEAIRVSNWCPTRRHKVDLLQRLSPDFAEKVTALHLHALQDANGITEVNSFIKFYCKTFLKEGIFDIKKNDTLIVDIAYDEFTLTGFVLGLLPRILENSVLSVRFKYYYLSPTKYFRLYKNEISLCFSVDSYTEAHTIETEVEKLFAENNMTNYTSEILFLPATVNEDVFALTDYYVKLLNRTCTDFITTYHEYNRKLFVDVALILSVVTIKELQLDVLEVVKINGYFMQRWLLRKYDQRFYKNNEEITALLEKRLEENKKTFSLNQKYIVPAILKALSSKDDSEYADESYFSLIRETGVFITKLKKIWRDEDDQISNQAMQLFKIRETRKASLYIHVLNHVFLLLNLQDTQKQFCLYVLTDVFQEMKEYIPAK